MPQGLNVLNGKDAKAFEDYQNRPGTPAEISHFKKAEKFFLSHLPKNWHDSKIPLKSSKRS